jgi:hypothetical protein
MKVKQNFQPYGISNNAKKSRQVVYVIWDGVAERHRTLPRLFL